MIHEISITSKGRHKRESKNAKQMRNTKQNCFSHSSASPRNDKQCSAKQCFANQTNRCLAGFASRSDLFRDNARLTKHRRKVNQRHLILQAMYTTMWLESDCWLAVSHMFRWKLNSRIKQCFFVSEWRRRETVNVLNSFVSWFLFLVFWLSFVAALRLPIQFQKKEYMSVNKSPCKCVPYIYYEHNMVAHMKYPQIMLKIIEIWDMSTHFSLGKTCPFTIILGTQTIVSKLSWCQVFNKTILS